MLSQNAPESAALRHMPAPPPPARAPHAPQPPTPGVFGHRKDVTQGDLAARARIWPLDEVKQTVGGEHERSRTPPLPEGSQLVQHPDLQDWPYKMAVHHHHLAVPIIRIHPGVHDNGKTFDAAAQPRFQPAVRTKAYAQCRGLRHLQHPTLAVTRPGLYGIVFCHCAPYTRAVSPNGARLRQQHTSCTTGTDFACEEVIRVVI